MCSFSLDFDILTAQNLIIDHYSSGLISSSQFSFSLNYKEFKTVFSLFVIVKTIYWLDVCDFGFLPGFRGGNFVQIVLIFIAAIFRS